jgi:hypothetical protein
MTIELSEDATRARFVHYMDEPQVVKGIQETINDRFLLAFFLMSVSEGEAMGESGVASIREEEIANLIHDIERQQIEEAGHKQLALDLARELFPEFFDDGHYRFSDRLSGREYYVAVLQQNRDHLKQRGAYSKLNIYLTTTFGYEIMVGLYYSAVLDAVATSDLEPGLKDPLAKQLRRILDEEDTHLEIATQHNHLLEAALEGLSPKTIELLEGLGALTADDYEWAAELSMKQVVKTIGRYADGARYRAEIESGSAGEA